MNRYQIFLLLLLSGAAAGLHEQAVAELVNVEVEARQTIPAETAGGPADYEKISGSVFFEFDPEAKANQAIADIEFAPRNARGRVEARANFMVLQPAREEDRSGIAWLEVSNRGGKASLRYFNAATTRVTDPVTAADFGDGLLMRQGLTLIWVGWQFDVPDTPGLLRLHAPVATRAGKPISGLVRSDWVIDERVHTLALSHRNHMAYAAADAGDPRNVLTRRRGREATREIVPRNTWRFARELDGKVVDDAGHIYSQAGFAPGYIYELVYVAEDPRIVGLGLAAVRDMMSYAKYEKRSPFKVAKGVGFGVSQTGRFLRQFLYQGFNVDEQGRKVFDGLLIHTAGAGRGSFNHRFGQPSRDGHRYSAFFYPTDIFPFSSRSQKDPVTGKRDGLLAVYKDKSKLPKIMYTNTGYEYWGRSASLMHVSLDGRRDVIPFANERIYHLASGQHFVGQWPPDKNTDAVWRSNPLDFLVNLRALMTRLVSWVREDAPPPASRYPKLKNNTLIRLQDWRFPRNDVVTAPRAAQLAYRADYGPEWRDGIVTKQPPDLGEAFPVLVPALDRFGNEVGGVRNVEIRAPLATYTPWQPRFGLANSHEMTNFLGMLLALPQSVSRGLYPRREAYLAKVDAAVEELIAEGFLLEEDAERVRNRALET
ncbi:MAG: hypothetical protein MJA83_19720, partial [Gammaproteobacteria bacterium]|nr:hypothetical protein [Gammaproteobacteria bacterium]